MNEPDPDTVASLAASNAAQRARFLEFVEGVRPRLHRYCAKMVG